MQTGNKEFRIMSIESREARDRYRRECQMRIQTRLRKTASGDARIRVRNHRRGGNEHQIWLNNENQKGRARLVMIFAVHHETIIALKGQRYSVGERSDTYVMTNAHRTASPEGTKDRKRC